MCGKALASAKKYHFYKMGVVSPPVCEEHVHTGRPHTRLNNRVFKKFQVMSFQGKIQKNLKMEKNQDLNKSKNS